MNIIQRFLRKWKNFFQFSEHKDLMDRSTLPWGATYWEIARSCGSSAQALSSSDEKAVKDLKTGEAWRTFPIIGIQIAFLKLLFIRGAWIYFWGVRLRKALGEGGMLCCDFRLGSLLSSAGRQLVGNWYRHHESENAFELHFASKSNWIRSKHPQPLKLICTTACNPVINVASTGKRGFILHHLQTSVFQPVLNSNIQVLYFLTNFSHHELVSLWHFHYLQRH